MCVSLHSSIGLMCVHVLLKTEICLQPFAVSKPISEAKLYRWNLTPVNISLNILPSYMLG